MGPGNTGSLVGRTLGEYHLDALLGAGGMAEVYRGQDVALEREVAVKVLPASLAMDAGYVERFREEAKRVALLSHPHIVPVYAFGEQDGLLYLVMPIMRESLRDRMSHEPKLTPNDSARLVVQIASALDAAHAQGIVHRDVKPENILLDADGKAHLTDFGIARDMDFLRQTGNNRTLAATGLPVGTPEYMAPEQLRAAMVDQRADVYALGAVLYELLTGVAPHEASTPYEVAALVLTSSITPPSERNPEIWPALDEVVMVALASDAEQRFADMRRFAMALRRGVQEKDAGIAKLTMPARSLTGIPAIALTKAAGISDSRYRKAGAAGTAVAEWPARPQTGPLGELPAKPKLESGGKKALVIALLVVVALVGVIGGSGLALLNTFGGGIGGGQAGNTATSGDGGGVPIVGSGPGAAATNTAVRATQTAVVIAQATSTAEGTPNVNPTSTTGPGTPTATPTSTATATASPTATPIPYPLSRSPSPKWYISHGNPDNCRSQETIVNNGNTTVTWAWQPLNVLNGGTPSLSGTLINGNGSTNYSGTPNDSVGLPPGQTDTVIVVFGGCQKHDRYRITVTDSLGYAYSAITVSIG